MAPSMTATDITDTTHSNWSDNPSVTPRKVPHCTKCKRPRAGHPRSGCPYTDSPTGNSPSRGSNASQPVTPLTSRKKVASDRIVEAMGSMQIVSSPVPESEEDMKATIRNRRRKSQAAAIPLGPSESLLSLSTHSGEIIEKLMQPGILDEDTEPEDTPARASGKAKGKQGRIAEWQDTLRFATNATPKPQPVKKSTRSPMPGTLVTPGTSFEYSYASLPKQGMYPATQDAAASFVSTDTVTPLPRHKGAKPLVRSMSLEERDLFISQLGNASKAMIHILPKADIYAIADAAQGLGYHANIVMNENEGDEQALLVLGRDEVAVGKLLKTVQEAEELKKREKEGKPTAPKGRSKASALKVAAGGAVMGAVGTWAGLAFA